MSLNVTNNRTKQISCCVGRFEIDSSFQVINRKMGDLNYLLNETNILATAYSINKLVRSISDNKCGNAGSTIPNGIELLKNLCRTSNPQTAQLAVHALVHLVNNGAVELSQVLNIFVTALTNSSSAHVVAISNGMFEILLMDLKRRSAALGNGEYVCQFGMKQPQHPLIPLLANKNVGNMLCFGTKISEICHHHDPQ